MGKVLQGYKKVFSRKRYILLALFISVLFYVLNVIISNFSSIKSFFSSLSCIQAIKITYFMAIGFYETIYLSSFVSLIIISILFGLLISILVYKTRNVKKNAGKKIGVVGTIGIFAGVIAPGCAACGLGIASALGLGAFLTFLPYKGLELSILAIILLIVANLKASKTLLSENICKINGKQ